jgi:hypothetical protein
MNKKLVIGIALMILAYCVLQDRRLKRGIRNIADDVMSYGLDDVLSALLA